MTTNPYADLPDHAFWRRAVVAPAPGEIDPVADVPFDFTPQARVVTAGSCFAQHIGRYLQASGCAFLVTERPHPLVTENAARILNYGVFTARYGNVYTARQLRQLFQRAYGAFRPAEDVWTQCDGTLVDPFRPHIQPRGFNSEREFAADRERHFRAVREAFQTLDVLVFTLGLTEAWRSRVDGAVFPICPGVSGGVFSAQRHEFVNFGVDDIVGDMTAFIADLRAVNPRARIILTVSPVPLVATASGAHVLAATTYSKSVLRVAAETLASKVRDVSYFPSYEIVIAGRDGVPYFAADRRSVTEEGVAHVMRVFTKHYVRALDPSILRRVVSSLLPPRPEPAPASPAEAMQAALKVMCDEEALDWAKAEDARSGAAE